MHGGFCMVISQFFINLILFLSSAVGIQAYYGGRYILFFICAGISVCVSLRDIIKDDVDSLTLHFPVMAGIGGTIYQAIHGQGFSFIFHNIGIFILFVEALIYAIATLISLYYIKKLYYNNLDPREKSGLFFCVVAAALFIIIIIGFNNTI